MNVAVSKTRIVNICMRDMRRRPHGNWCLWNIRRLPEGMMANNECCVDVMRSVVVANYYTTDCFIVRDRSGGRSSGSV